VAANQGFESPLVAGQVGVQQIGVIQLVAGRGMGYGSRVHSYCDLKGEWIKSRSDNKDSKSVYAETRNQLYKTKLLSSGKSKTWGWGKISAEKKKA
jgi:ribonuclease HII